MTFSKNDYFDLDGEKITILDQLGEGGQGEVYLVDRGSKKYAFKYYKEIPDSDFVYNLKNNISKGSPSDSFLWPLALIEFDDGHCGYFMDLRPKNYVSFISYLTGTNRFNDQITLINWCIELAKSFKLLHEKGYSYQDLNDGSFFLDKDTGKLLICDNDNVSADKTNLGILGKMRYMAPEIVRGDKDKLTGERQMPDTHSDRFSLAIILFLAFCLGNPFEGECLKKYVIVDEKAEYEMFGSHPVYIYSDKDMSNRPIRGYHTAVINRYPSLPSYIKDEFQKTFTLGLTDRENSRTTELQWLKVLCRYRDEIITCGCGKQYMYGFSEKKCNDKCPNCHTPTRKFCYLKLGKHNIVLEPDKCIYKFHIDKYSDGYSEPVAKVIRNKNNPNVWGLKLHLDNEVQIKDKDGNERTIAKDGVIPIIANLKIKFTDTLIGEILCLD